MTTRRIALGILTLCLVLSQTACLKTRAQIKGGDQAQEEATETESKNSHKASYETDEIKHEITRISGKLEELDHAQRSQNALELKEYTARLDSRIAELEKNQLLLLSELKSLKDSKETSAREAATPSVDFLTAGNQLLAEKKYEDAAEKFKSLLNKNVKGKVSADAHYGLGEAEFGMKNYNKAIVQFSKVEEASAKSSKIPQSLYKIALAFQHLNKPKESKGFFAELVERYPKSPEAKKARGKIKE